jgi:hypothetical protein
MDKKNWLRNYPKFQASFTFTDTQRIHYFTANPTLLMPITVVASTFALTVEVKYVVT